MAKNSIRDIVRNHEELKLSGINLIASENRIAPHATQMLAGDLAGRYGTNWYGGTRYAVELCSEVEQLAKKVFSAKYAFVTPLSGNMCDLAALFAFSMAGDIVAGIPWTHGGYPLNYAKFQRAFAPLPMKEYLIDETLLDGIPNVPLVLLASSTILFPHPVGVLAHHMSGTLVYDASHVLGLIAGGSFQRPLIEGAHVMVGSTHKSLPGPQGGLIVTNDKLKAERLAEFVTFDLEKGIGLVDNPHLNRIACLGIVLEDTLEHGKDYAHQIVNNAQALGAALADLGVPVKYEEDGYTQSHQLLLDISTDNALTLHHRLEKNYIFADRMARLGVAEVTSIGMKEIDMETIAHLIAEVYHGADIGDAATKLASRFYL